MRFNPKARIDSGNVSDAGGGGGGGGLGGGGMRLPIPTGGRMGCGSLLLIAVVMLINAFVLDNGMPGLPGGDGGTGTGADPGTSQNGAQPGGSDERYGHCKTGEDANESHDCARKGVELSLTDYWKGQFSGDFRPAGGIRTFSGQVDTACGGASSQVGPFYCPADFTIYLDTTFFDQVLEQQLGGPDGGFVEWYVLAHEYGHHISNITGQMRQVQTQQGPDSDAVKLELQADCYAGMWSRNATRTKDPEGNVLIEDVSKEDLNLAMEAAATVGDDRIQEKTQGQVSPEAWTHGSAKARQAWFYAGFDSGDAQVCDTWQNGTLDGEDWLPKGG